MGVVFVSAFHCLPVFLWFIPVDLHTSVEFTQVMPAGLAEHL